MIILKILAGLAFYASIPLSIIYVVNDDNEELLQGKSPHSGFCPDYPEAFDGLEKPSRPSRYEDNI
jgi:hypothetical protein